MAFKKVFNKNVHFCVTKVLHKNVCYEYWAMCYEVFLMCYNRNPRFSFTIKLVKP